MSSEPGRRARARRRTVIGSGLAAIGSATIPITAEPASAEPEEAATDEITAAWTDPPNGYPEWNNNIGIFQVGSEPAHATFMPYADLQQALKADRTDSPYRLGLDGDWRFQHAGRPADRDLGFWRTDVDDSDWDTMPVPANWQPAGYDFPI
jgi:beta-galactosidase